LELQSRQTVVVNDYILKFPKKTVFSVVKSERFSHAQAKVELLEGRPQWRIAEQIIINSPTIKDFDSNPIELITCYLLQKT